MHTSAPTEVLAPVYDRCMLLSDFPSRSPTLSLSCPQTHLQGNHRPRKTSRLQQRHCDLRHHSAKNDQSHPPSPLKARRQRHTQQSQQRRTPGSTRTLQDRPHNFKQQPPLRTYLSRFASSDMPDGLYRLFPTDLSLSRLAYRLLTTRSPQRILHTACDVPTT